MRAGATATAVYASSKSWAIVIPAEAWSGGIASAILIGAFAGLMPPFERLGCRPPWHCERCERESDLYPEATLRRAFAVSAAEHRQRDGCAGASVGVTDHVDDDAVRVADEEAPRAPGLFGQWVDDLVAAPASFCVGRIDVVDIHADGRVLGRGGIP